MNQNQHSWAGALGTAGAFSAVALGAFGAHALRARLEPGELAIYQTAVQYQFYHALALVLWELGWRFGSLRSRWVPRLFSAGIVLFSGSLYALVLTGVRALGAITPIGGLAWLIAWALWTIEFGFGKRIGSEKRK